MDYNLIRFYETVYRGISQDFLVGLGYHLNHYFGIVDHNAPLREWSPRTFSIRAGSRPGPPHRAFPSTC